MCLRPLAAQVSSAMKHLYTFPAAPPGPNRDGVLRWLEAFADRLWDGTFQVRRRSGACIHTLHKPYQTLFHVIILFCERSPGCNGWLDLLTGPQVHPGRPWCPARTLQRSPRSDRTAWSGARRGAGAHAVSPSCLGGAAPAGHGAGCWVRVGPLTL